VEKLAIEGGEPVRKGKSRIPLHEPLIGEEEIRAVAEVLRSKRLVRTYGDKTSLFEKMLANYFEVKYAVAVNTGTAAVHLAIATLDIGPGNEVICSPIGFITSNTPVLWQNAIPVFADVDEEWGMITAEHIRKRITKHTKAIIVVHLYGHPADMDPIIEEAEKHGLYVIEDFSQAIGAEYKGRKVGTIGIVNAASLHQSKVITTGEGGFILTNDHEIYEKAFSLSNFGRPLKELHAYTYDYMGYNYRLSEIMAAIGIEQLRKIDYIIEKRRENARYLTKKLEHLEGEGIYLPREPPWGKSVWWIYHIKLDSTLAKYKWDIIKALNAEGIGAWGWVIPDNLQPFYLNKRIYGNTHCPWSCPYYTGGNIEYRTMCPTAKEFVDSTFWLTGCSPTLSREDLDDIAYALEKVIRAFKVKVKN